VLAHHGRGCVARPDLGLITEMLDDCTARGRTLLGTLGEVFTRASWTRTDQAHVQPCLNAIEAHLRRGVETLPAEGRDPRSHRPTASVLLKIARTLPEPVMPAFWEMTLRLPEDVHVQVINALANNATRNQTLISSLMLAQAAAI